jgi:hypothetical protein
MPPQRAELPRMTMMKKIHSVSWTGALSRRREPQRADDGVAESMMLAAACRRRLDGIGRRRRVSQLNSCLFIQTYADIQMDVYITRYLIKIKKLT